MAIGHVCFFWLDDIVGSFDYFFPSDRCFLETKKNAIC